MLVFQEKQIFHLFLVVLKRTAFLAVLFLLLAPWQKVSAVGFEEVCRGSGAGVCDSGLECDSAEDICLGSNGYVCQNNNDCANGLSCLAGKCAVDLGAGQGERLGLGKSTSDLRDQIRTFINIFLGFLGVLGVLMMIYGGFLWMTSRGNAEQVKKAKQTLLYAVLGMLVILISWTITSYILYLGQKVGGTGEGSGGRGDITTLPPEPPSPAYFQMLMQEVSTTYAGNEPHQQVHPRCAINMIFNVPPTAESLSAALGSNPPTIKVQDKTETIISRSYSLSANAITYDPAIQSSLILNQDDNPHNLIIPINNNPFPIRGKSGEKEYLLQGCTETMEHCTVLETETYWTFDVGDDSSQPPARLSASIPAINEENYNGNYIKLVYDRDIYPPSFITGQIANPTNIEFGQLNSNCEPGLVEGCIFTKLPVENLTAYLITGSSLKFIWQGEPWSPFTWYRLTGHKLTDSCGNEIADLAINFKTGAGAYLDGYPPNDSFSSCETGTKVWAWSSVSLFDPLNPEACNYELTGQFKKLNGADWEIDPSRSFTPRYNPMLGPDNPDPDCQYFDFLPTAKLDSTTKYQAEISSNFKINKEGDVLGKIWEFNVMSDAECDPPPVIEQLSPSNGPQGQCFTIVGDYFQGADFDPTKVENKIIFQTLDPTPVILPELQAQDEKIASWSDNNIVAYLPQLESGGIDIRMERFSKKLGSLKSNTKSFTVQTGAIDNPICLIEVKGPDGIAESLAGEEIKLTGQNFTFTGPEESLLPQTDWWNKATSVQFNDAVLAYSYYWTKDFANNESANADVPGSLVDGEYLVSVHKMIKSVDSVDFPNGQNVKSNELKFIIKPPDPTKPRVIDYSGCENGRLQTPSPPKKTDVCLIDYNGEKRIIFFLEYDRKIDAKAAEFSLEDCGQGLESNCQGNFIGQKDDYKIDDNQPVLEEDNEGVEITMLKGNLLANNWYQAKISGIKDETNPIIFAADYSWSFKTKEPLTICEIDKVDVSLSKNEIIYKAGEDNASLASAKATDTDTCQQLDAGQFSWNWSAEDITGESDKPIASLDSDHHTADNEVIATGEDFGQANIKAEWDKSQIIGSAVLKVTTGDPTLCDPHQLESCLQSGDCMGSQCILTTDGQHHCTPVVKNLSPAQGPAGTWLEIEGCHFGEEQGKVNFNGEAEGIFKFPEQCKSFWTNEKILTEVPTIVDIGLKSIKVITSLELGSNDDQKFDLTKDPLLPQLCGLNTTSGERKSTFIAYGKFDSQVAETSVFVGNEESTDIDKSQSEIKSKVGPNAQLGEQVVKVIQDEQQSPQEDIKFIVTSGDGPITPEQEFIQILDYSPKADNVCQNAVVSVKFDSLIDYDNLKNNLTLIDENGNPAQCLYNQSTAALPYWQKVFAFLKKLIKNVYAGEEIGDCGVWEFTSTNNSTTAFLNPGDLDPVHYLQNENYFINIKTKGDDILVSKQGGILRQEECLSAGGLWDQSNPDIDVAFCKLPFPGGKDICIADRITINNDENEIFLYDKNKTEPNGNGKKELNLFGYYGNILINLQSGIESGDYSSPIWQVIPENDIITLDKKDGVNNIAYAFSLNSPIGSNVVQVNTTVSQTGKKLSDTIIATLSLCASDIDDPGQYFWKFYDPLIETVDPEDPLAKVNSDPPGNFSLSYCRYQKDQPENPLPLISDIPIFPQENQISKNAEMDILKEYYFKFQADANAPTDSPDSDANFLKQPYAKDFFILRIMPNWEQEYLNDWLSHQPTNGPLKGILLPEIQKKGYDYEKTLDTSGLNFFVNALNLVKDDPTQDCEQTDCKMFTNIYILSYNQGAAQETEEIFKQLKNNWQFNTNFYNDSGFIIAGVTEEQIQRDWQRIRDLNSIASALDNYQLSHQGKYPYQTVLGTGVKPLGVAVSKWEDEWSNLGKELKISLPYDPINIIQCKDTKGKPPECVYKQGAEGEKRGTYYCQAHHQCSDYNETDCNKFNTFCKWENNSCKDIEGNTGTYAYQYQLTGECYRYDEVEVKCNLFGDNNIKENCKDPCVWHEPDAKEPKFRQEPGRCESICSDPQNSAFQDKANYCFWKIEDQRCYSTAAAYDLYANFEYSPVPWCNAKKAEHCKEYSFCRLENSECIAPSLTNDQQPLCSGFAEPVFNVIF